MTAIEQRARRAAIRIGLRAEKSSDRTIHANNLGDFMLIDQLNNTLVAGINYSLSAEKVIALSADALPAVPYCEGSDVMCFAGWRSTREIPLAELEQAEMDQWLNADDELV
jgi:hypothetical protein